MSKRITLAAAVVLYLNHASVRLRPRTLSNRRSYLHQVGARLGRLHLDEIDVDRLEDYQRQRRAAGLRPGTVNSELSAFRSLRTWATKRAYKVGAVPELLPDPVPVDVAAWSQAEIEMLCAAAARLAPGLVPLILFLANTGCREGEALALKWEHLDFKRRRIRIWPTREWAPKSGRRREVPMNAILFRELGRLPRRGEWVFCSRKGTRYARWPQAQFDRARRAAGLVGGPHRLRHAYATELLTRRPDLGLPVVGQILGHRDERTTRRYTHLVPGAIDHAREAVRFEARVPLWRRVLRFAHDTFVAPVRAGGFL